jgi:hypothetical protein
MSAMDLETARTVLSLWCGERTAKEKAQPVRAGLSRNWCRLQDSNPPPDDYKSTALPDELSRL